VFGGRGGRFGSRRSDPTNIPPANPVAGADAGESVTAASAAHAFENRERNEFGLRTSDRPGENRHAGVRK